MNVPTRLRIIAGGDSHFFRRWPDWAFIFWPTRLLQRLLCLVGGHDPVPDLDGEPEHDACLWCKKSMPGQVRRRKYQA